jgi:hypothetical protein
MSEVTDKHGDCVDLSDDERVLQSSVLSGALIGYPIQLNAPDRATKVSVVSLVPGFAHAGTAGSRMNLIHPHPSLAHNKLLHHQ